MAEHHELVAEMSLLEHMGTQERQKLAKKRRLQQLKKWGQREKEWIAKEKQLNKRLANMLNEENNGLNLKNYTTYSSSHRSKKKANHNNNDLSTATNNIITNGKKTSNDFLNNNNNGNNNHTSDADQIPARYRASNGVTTTTTTDSSLAPNGRVHFNVGVMLLEAAARNDYDEVKRLLMLGVSPDSINHDGLTALHQCCIDASEPMMNLLLEFGANVDARDTEQWTPLHAACTCGHLNLVKILVENGADLLAVNGDGNMPFDICEDESTSDYIETEMIKRGITQEMIDFTRASTEMQMISDLEKQVSEGKDLNAANELGVTQLHVAAANGYLSVVKFLLRYGVNVNVYDNDYWRPLHGAACWGNEQHIKVIEHLVEAGAQLDAKTINDETAFDLCDNVDLLERLNQLKDELESKQNSGSDRLRRTQSRTNSRVHSIRRTSVRDKNQISRREAREEALLRVENSPAVADPTNPTNGPNGVGNVDQLTSPADDVENKKRTETITNSPLTEKFDNTDQVDCHLSQKLGLNTSDLVNGHHSYEQTNLDDVSLPMDSSDSNSQQRSHELTNHQSNGIRSQPSSAHTSNDSIANNRKQLITPQNQSQVEDAIASSQSARADIKPEFTNLISNSKPHGATLVASLSQDIIQTLPSGVNKATTTTNTINNERICEIDTLSNNDNTACDQNLQNINSQSSSSMVLAPINYTLSNLKKQRSDLRMRNTSIGGNNNISVSSTSANGKQALLEPQPASLTINGIYRPESPSLTFRKFRGDPSEVVGGVERDNRHKCCILI